MLNSAFTLNQLAGQLRFISTQSDTSNVEIDGRTPDIISATSATKDNVQLLLAAYFAPEMTQLPSSHWLDSCFASTEAIPVDQRYKWLLAGRPATGYIDPGPLVCSCMAVGENIIINAITNEQCRSAQAVGNACRAGTNCGSCISQINELIAQYAHSTRA
ncbi:(2Fe-2S)-binding protein [Psychrobacter okhotskensis]|uniref:(2Fe-2S)-binding protein n=1 Tax=Psychrobacter okhotskensis TaxID=212403 RepID=UPI003CFFA67F